MVGLAQIHQRQAPDIATFAREHWSTRTPVLLRGMFEGRRIRELTSEAQAREQLGRVRLLVLPEYHRAYRRGGFWNYKPTPRTMQLATYLKYAERHPKTGLLCTEQPLPDEIAPYLAAPPYCRLGHRTATPITSKIFLANRGNVAHLHFDGDYNHVLLYQVFGQKRVVLLPPQAASALEPTLNFSGHALETMTADAQAALLRQLGAVECVLQPGDALYMPPLVWHYVEYLDTGMSVNFRWGRPAHADFLQDIHPNVFLQNVAASLLAGPPLSPQKLHKLARIRRVYEAPSPSRLARSRAVEATCAELSKVKDVPRTPDADLRRLIRGGLCYRHSARSNP